MESLSRTKSKKQKAKSKKQKAKSKKQKAKPTQDAHLTNRPARESTSRVARTKGMKIVPDSEPEPRQIPTEYLLDKYETQGMTALKEILRQRAGDASVGFTTWLSRLRTEGAAPAPLVARLKQDVVNSLKATQSPQRFGYKG